MVKLAILLVVGVYVGFSIGGLLFKFVIAPILERLEEIYEQL